MTLWVQRSARRWRWWLYRPEYTSLGDRLGSCMSMTVFAWLPLRRPFKRGCNREVRTATFQTLVSKSINIYVHNFCHLIVSFGWAKWTAICMSSSLFCLSLFAQPTLWWGKVARACRHVAQTTPTTRPWVTVDPRGESVPAGDKLATCWRLFHQCPSVATVPPAHSNDLFLPACPV